jgi:GNAT superfamily N-acetyltransferase
MLVVAREPSRSIRACRREDLPGVVELYEAVMRSGRRSPPPGLAAYFERTFFDSPWADPEIPSLVYEDKGRIVGFLGSHVRRMRLDGQPARFACGGQLVSDPEARGRAVGAVLFRTHLKGRQDATFTDGANETVRRMWEACGGESSPLKTISWTRILQPVRFGGGYALRRLERPQLARRLDGLWKPLDALALRVAKRRFALPPRRTVSEPLTPRAILDNLREVMQFTRCHPDYDEAFLEWLFREMAAVRSRGTLARSLVRDAKGQALGWYVYYLDGAIANAVQVTARRGAAGEVLDELFHHAAASGAAAVCGRLEPQLADALAERRCSYGWSGAALLYGRTPAVTAVLLSTQCALGLMDGESWMGHHREEFS